MRILLIDDDQDFIEAQRSLLEAEGYEVLAARDGVSGLALAMSSVPHLIVLDVMMSECSDGVDVSRKLKSAVELRHIPVILLTGMRSELRLPSALRPDADWLPVQVVLEKPVEPKRLLAEIRKHLVRKP